MARAAARPQAARARDELAVADGALGFWKAIDQVWSRTRGQRWGAQDRERLGCPRASNRRRVRTSGWPRPGADNAFDTFIETYAVKYEKAAACLAKDRALLAFYDFPAEHWKHLRTTNPIESTFATVRHRTVRSKGCLSNKTALAMVFKLTQGAQNSWRRLDGHNQLPKLIVGVKFTDASKPSGNNRKPPPDPYLIVTKIRRGGKKLLADGVTGLCGSVKNICLSPRCWWIKPDITYPWLLLGFVFYGAIAAQRLRPRARRLTT